MKIRFRLYAELEFDVFTNEFKIVKKFVTFDNKTVTKPKKEPKQVKINEVEVM